jgi:DNA-directed RNA polymerase specialized sigma24 family protein
MTQEDSVTHWFHLLRQGDHHAAQPLWDRYFSRLEALARKMLQGCNRAVVDAEDIALSAFDSMARGLQRGRFPQLHDRDNLWKVLVVITARKVSHLRRDQHCQKRGGGPAAVGRVTVDPVELEQVMGEEPTPEFAVQAAEQYHRLLACLPHKDLQQIAVWKMEGYTNEEIAERSGCAPRTIDRKLQLIRHLWEQEAEP